VKRSVFRVSMTENASLTGSIDQIELDFVERELTLKLLMKLDI
jgi:hypothetical protein